MAEERDVSYANFPLGQARVEEEFRKWLSDVAQKGGILFVRSSDGSFLVRLDNVSVNPSSKAPEWL